MPSTSPGRGRRVVTDTETQTSGCRRRTSATTVPLPTPDGPESTVSRAGVPAATRRPRSGRPVAPSSDGPLRGDLVGDDLVTAELRLQRPALVRTQTTDA